MKNGPRGARRQHDKGARGGENEIKPGFLAANSPDIRRAADHVMKSGSGANHRRYPVALCQSSGGGRERNVIVAPSS